MRRMASGAHARAIRVRGAGGSRAGERHHRQRCADRDTVVVEDVHNELRPWFQARGRDVVLVRPDRYIAALTTALARVHAPTPPAESREPPAGRGT
jgi:hypothetical protein